MISLIEVSQIRKDAARHLSDVLEETDEIRLRRPPRDIPTGCRNQGLWLNCERTNEETRIMRLANALKAEFVSALDDIDMLKVAERVYRDTESQRNRH